MPHPLLDSLHYLADASDPAHLAKLKADMEAEHAKSKAKEADWLNTRALKEAAAEALRKARDALHFAETRDKNLESEMRRVIAEKQTAEKSKDAAIAAYQAALAASK